MKRKTKLNNEASLEKKTRCKNQCCGSALVSMQIRIQLFISMRICIQGTKPMRIRILSRLYSHKNEKYRYLTVGDREKNISTKVRKNTFWKAGNQVYLLIT